MIRNKILKLITLIYSILLVYFYDGGDLLDYKNYYAEVGNYSILNGFLHYVGSLGASEPIYYVITYTSSILGVPHALLVIILNFLLISSYLNNFDQKNKFALFIAMSMLVGFHFSMLFTELERLKLGFIFTFIALSYEQRKWRYCLLMLAFLSHLSLLILFVVQILVDTLNPRGWRLKINFKNLIIGTLLILILLATSQESLQAKLQHYVRGLNYFSFIEAFLITIYFSFLAQRNRAEVMILGIIITLLSPFIGGGRLLIIALPIFFMRVQGSKKFINQLALFPIAMYYLIRGIMFFYNTVETGRGITI